MKLRTSLLSSALALAAPGLAWAAEPAEIIETYADIAQAGYEDSLIRAKALKAAVDALVAAPTEANLEAAKEAWRTARIPYQQTEVFRFGNPTVDDWEGKVNAWPLDEGLIDYVDPLAGGNDENPYSSANIIANPVLQLSGATIDATEITPEVLQSLHEADGIEENVATGYHAIEFLLWGQDLNGTGHGAGARPASDYDTASCTGGHCDRRTQYLQAATDLLVSDLEDAVANWSEGGQGRADVTADPNQGLVMAFTGLGALSYSEMAGDRMKLGLLLHDPEEEHDCFSDNTHNSHYFDALGIRNVYSGRYLRLDGSVVSGPSLRELVAARAPELAGALAGAIDHTLDTLGDIRNLAEAGMSYDEMIGAGNAPGNALVQAAIDGLVAQTRDIERALSLVGGGEAPAEGSDGPSAVFK